ncbi:MAG: tRNA lysidine(34) synthetase TilS [Bacteroidota bacterium]
MKNQHPLLGKLQDTIEAHTLCEKGGRILVAISGGPDSVFLSWALHQLGYEVGLAHVNYQMRGEDSDQEQALVESYGQAWDVPVYTKRVEGKSLQEGNKASFQVVAREIRYTFFEEIQTKFTYPYLATAHHKDDQVETLLMNLVKGSPFHVFKGIPVKMGSIIRPLLEVGKEEILAALADVELSYGTDVSNQSNVYLRNQIRNLLVPELLKINPSFPNLITLSFQHYQLQQHFLEDRLEEWAAEFEEGNILKWRRFQEEVGEAFVSVFIMHVLQKWGLHGHEVEACLGLIDSQVGKWVQTSIGKMYRIADGLEWQDENVSLVNQQIMLGREEIEGSYLFGKNRIILSLVNQQNIAIKEEGVHYLDLEKVRFPIHIRIWKEGDKMKPLGMNGKKKISDILNGLKVSPAHKPGFVVLEDQKGIFLLKGYRISEYVKLSSSSRVVLKIVFEEA